MHSYIFYMVYYNFILHVVLYYVNNDLTFILPLNKYRHVTKLLENLIFITYPFYYNIENNFQMYLKVYITKLSKQSKFRER